MMPSFIGGVPSLVAQIAVTESHYNRRLFRQNSGRNKSSCREQLTMSALSD